MRSPGRPIRRFTNVAPPSPAPHCAAFAGVLKTMICPRFGLLKRNASRFAITRSLYLPSHHVPGFAQWSVGSIDEDGIRYGFATSASNASTNTIASPIVTTQPTIVPQGWGIRFATFTATKIEASGHLLLPSVPLG